MRVTASSMAAFVRGRGRSCSVRIQRRNPLYPSRTGIRHLEYNFIIVEFVSVPRPSPQIGHNTPLLALACCE